MKKFKDQIYSIIDFFIQLSQMIPPSFFEVLTLVELAKTFKGMLGQNIERFLKKRICEE